MNGQINHAVSKVTYTKVGSEYRVVDALGRVSMLSTIDFLELYTPVAEVIQDTENYKSDIGKWAEDTAGPFEYSELDVRTMHPKTIDLTPIPSQTETIIKVIQNEERKHLSPDTIANLIQSNLERTPDGYSIDALSRTMLGRTGRHERRQ